MSSDAELPAPRGGRAQPAPTAGTFDLDDLMPDGADLPAPVGARGGGRGRSDSVSDLPAPAARIPPIRPIPSPAAGVTDLPAPRAARGVADLPAPVRGGGAGITDLPAPARGGGAGITDLPAPARGANVNITDLPAPARGANVNITDLPAPRTGSAGVTDLPAPRGGGPAGSSDLPAPRSGPAGVTDLPAPRTKSGGGFFDDLPQPVPTGARGGELPAPKGFFDDLPGPVNPEKPEAPAPKGFFDDLPGRPTGNAPEVPAPKGFFDDLPQPVQAQAAEVPAPKGFFDDLPGRPTGPGALPPAPKGFFDDLPQPSPAGKKPVNTPVELALDNTAAALDLGLETPTKPPSKYDNVDLSSPSAMPGLKFGTPSGNPTTSPSKQPPLPPLPYQAPPQQALELAEPRDTVPMSQKLGPRVAERVADIPRDPEAARVRARRIRILALAGLLVVGLGAFGFYIYSRWAAKKAAMSTITEQLAKARTSMGQSDPGHWDRAAAAALQVLDADDTNADGLVLLAEARLASALATGIDMERKLRDAKGSLQRAVARAVAPAMLKRAQALAAIATNDPERAITLLQPLITADPKDPVLQLYLGWAYAAGDDNKSAIAAFDKAVEGGADTIKLNALYGRGLARLELVDLAGAKADFNAVFEMDKKHIGAQVGLAAAMPAAQAQDQEHQLESLLARTDLGNPDKRALVRAWILIAEAAKRGNRLDAARDRYRKALGLMPNHVGAMAGLADVELRDGKIELAAEQIKNAINIAPNDIRAQLVQTAVSIARDDRADAKERVAKLAARNPPPPPLELAKIKLMAGKLADLDGDDEAAVAAYQESAELAGDTDLAPTLAAVEKLSKLADKATNEGNDDKAQEYRATADKMLSALEVNAGKDPQLALTLGVAYMRTDDAAKAEPWLRRYVEARPEEAEGQYQLAKALGKLGQTDVAINRLIKAQSLAPQRAEIGIELALTYEHAGQDDKAAEVYDKLLAETKDPGTELRARAGRFYAKRGEVDKAAEQGAKILEVDPKHLAGQYLKGEGELKAGRIDEARQLFAAAIAERDPQYFDALGRANESKYYEAKDAKYAQLAIDNYLATIGMDPKMFNPQAGLGRLYVDRKEYANAIGPLAAAWQIRQDPDVAFNTGRAYMGQRDADPARARFAIASFKTTVELDPRNGEAYYLLGQLYTDENKGREGEAALARAVALGIKAEQNSTKTVPWLTDAMYRLGAVSKQLNNLRQAKDAWEQYVGRPRDNEFHYKEATQALSTSLKRI